MLVDVDLAVAAGEFVGVVGPSGSGKTTLLERRRRFARAAPGRVIRERPAAIGYVPQVETVNWYFPVTVAGGGAMARIGGRGPPLAVRGGAVARPTTCSGGSDSAGSAAGTSASCPVGSSSACSSRGRCCASPSCCCSTNRRAGVDVRTRHEVVHLLHELHHDGLAIVVTTHDLNGIAAHLPSSSA